MPSIPTQTNVLKGRDYILHFSINLIAYSIQSITSWLANIHSMSETLFIILNTWYYWSKANRLPDFFFFFQQRWVCLKSPENCNCSLGETYGTPHMTMEKELFYGGRKDIGGDNSKQRIFLWLFIDWVLTRKEKEYFFFLLGSAMFVGYERTLQSPNSFVSFY